MDNQHRKITGYRELTQQEIDLINQIKAKGIEFGALIDRLHAHLSDAERSFGTPEERIEFLHAEPFRWLAIGKTHTQEAVTALVRSVARPTTFC